MIENKEELLCQGKHSQNIVSVNLDPNLEAYQRLLCQLCIYQAEESHCMGFPTAVQRIEENRKQVLQIVEDRINEDIRNLEQLQNDIITLKSQIAQQLDKMVEITKQWISNLQSQCSKYAEYSFIKELDSMIINKQYSIENEKINISNQITTLNQGWSNKIKNGLESFSKFEQYSKCIDILIRIEQQKNQIKQQQQQQQQQQLSPYKLEFINDQIVQHQKCRDIVFDPTGKIMVSTSDCNIKIWNFDNGQINLIDTLGGHQGNVYCLVYSKIKNQFFSGSHDNSIRLWNQSNNNKFQSLKPYVEHTNAIQCMILTENEDQLISGSRDESIKVWTVDLSNNELNLLYSLEKPKQYFVSLSLNQSGNLLVSCGEDGKIIIWQKRDDNFQEYQQVVNLCQEHGRHVKFLNENQFIWVPYKSNYICIFESTEGVYQENIQKRVEFNKDNRGQTNLTFFPIIYNKDKNLICLRHIQHIFILKIQKDGNLSVVEKLDYQNFGIYGTITNNGQYLVFWGGRKNKYETYEISYQYS